MTRLALLQLAPAGPGEQPGDALRDRLQGLAHLSVDLVLMPELLLPGYNQPHAHRERAAELDGGTCTTMAALARETGLTLAYGWAERSGDLVYNAASVMDPAGQRIAHYRKLQLFGELERKSFAPGKQAPGIFECFGRKTALLICYDIEFPEHARALARQGVDLLLVPTANPTGFEHVQELLIPARAYENRMTVAYANYAGPDGDMNFGGRSLVAGPDGRVLASAGATPAMLIVDLPEAGQYRDDLLSTQLADLRLP